MTAQHDEGRRAYAEGKARHENPYAVNTEQWNCWMDGFDQAESDAANHSAKQPIDR